MDDESTHEPTLEDFALAISLLVRRIRADAPPELREFSWTQKAVLTRLEKEGAMTSADLARAERIKPQSMSSAIASLVTMGLIERHAHPTDGRQMLIKLSAKGTKLRRTTREAKHAWLAQAITRLNKQEQALLFKAGALIARMVEDERD
ncbi:MarR family winged helix-turn-helix transcriptional regulator [Pararobbsia silviterrae]|uniref:MarR family transcriptional regulator n=1 Tax=Pararobbsia silviterrae TaxID=1792498 RepID=A0A494XSN9_9BURK|nr:MarR family transcriptional regulator [Pararobbsia silviterrae]RKP53660.1 MarR family transcriptional regulator [Pararobbsia silviterrae]